MSDTQVVVVGAGAAGIVAALFAARAGASVLLLERTRDGGRKILISGGGRCNVLPSTMSPAQYVTASSPNTMRKMLLSWPLEEQHAFFEQELRVPLAVEPETGKVFPRSNRAREVRDALIGATRSAGVQVRFDVLVRDVAPADDGWHVTMDDGARIAARSVVLATGGLSVPATGSDGSGLTIARRLGHEIHETYPALTPLTATPAVHASLAGISLRATLEAPLAKGRATTTGGFLFTHRGYSGPAVLDISHHAVQARLAGRAQPVLVQWSPHDAAAWDAMLRAPGPGTVGALIQRHLPARLADALAGESHVDGERTLAALRREERAALVTMLTRYPLPWTGDEGYKKAEVTGGGVALGEVEPRTLESRRHHGLFLCGEMLDAFGPIGGYNFLWGWATGRTAGSGAGALVNR